MTEKESKELRQKQDNEILQEINGEEEVEYGLINDYMFRAVFQTSEEALRGIERTAQCIVTPSRRGDIILCNL